MNRDPAHRAAPSWQMEKCSRSGNLARLSWLDGKRRSEG
jgi:hypothetical protein